MMHNLKNNNFRLDFLWSSHKEYISLKPLYNLAYNQKWDVRFKKVHKSFLRNFFTLGKLSKNIIISHDSPLKRVKKMGWSGKYIYIEHGLSPMKYYTYKYSFFHEADLLFYPGKAFERKMKAINLDFKNGLIGGYPKMDELFNMKINRLELCKKYNLNDKKPIILFAPSWGGKYSNNAGINNIKYFKDIENVIAIPHPADYLRGKKYNCVIPSKGENINQFIHLADIIISDVSSVLVEGSLLDKTIIQLLLDEYPGCFPHKDKRTEKAWISSQIINEECNMIKDSNHPFKIPYTHEDWILGHICKPENVHETIKRALNEKKKYAANRLYWGEECCYRFDGKICSNILAMINNFLENNEIKQLEMIA